MLTAASAQVRIESRGGERCRMLTGSHPFLSEFLVSVCPISDIKHHFIPELRPSYPSRAETTQSMLLLNTRTVTDALGEGFHSDHEELSVYNQT